MTLDVFSKVAAYGKIITVADTGTNTSRQGRGFIQPSNVMEYDMWRRLTPAGASRDSVYLLIAAPELIENREDQMTVSCDGKEYTVLRVEPMYLGDKLTHWEGTIRLKGGA